MWGLLIWIWKRGTGGIRHFMWKRGSMHTSQRQMIWLLLQIQHQLKNTFENSEMSSMLFFVKMPNFLSIVILSVQRITNALSSSSCPQARWAPNWPASQPFLRYSIDMMHYWVSKVLFTCYEEHILFVVVLYGALKAHPVFPRPVLQFKNKAALLLG